MRKRKVKETKKKAVQRKPAVGKEKKSKHKDEASGKPAPDSSFIESYLLFPIFLRPSLQHSADARLWLEGIVSGEKAENSGPWQPQEH